MVIIIITIIFFHVRCLKAIFFSGSSLQIFIMFQTLFCFTIKIVIRGKHNQVSDVLQPLFFFWRGSRGEGGAISPDLHSTIELSASLLLGEDHSNRKEWRFTGGRERRRQFIDQLQRSLDALLARETKENRLPTDTCRNFIQTLCVSSSAFIRGLYIGLITGNPLMISYYDVIKKYSLFDQLRPVVFE